MCVCVYMYIHIYLERKREREREREGLSPMQYGSFKKVHNMSLFYKIITNAAKLFCHKEPYNTRRSLSKLNDGPLLS